MGGVLTHIELIGIIVTLIIGFGGLSYQIGRWTKKTDAVQEKMAEVEGWIGAHDNKCDHRESRTNERLAEGSTKMAILDERTKAMQEDIREIKEAVKR